MRTSLDHAIQHIATCDRTHFADMEYLTDLDQTEGQFALLWCQHAAHRRLDLVDHVVNDVVVADINTRGFSQLACRSICTHIETNDDGFGGQREVDIGFTDTTHCSMHHLHSYFGRRKFLQ